MADNASGSGDEFGGLCGGGGGLGVGVADEQGGQQGGGQDGDRADREGGGHRGGVGLPGGVDQAALTVRGGQGAGDRLPGLRGRAGRHVAGEAAGQQRAEDRDAQRRSGLLDGVVQGRSDARLLRRDGAHQRADRGRHG